MNGNSYPELTANQKRVIKKHREKRIDIVAHKARTTEKKAQRYIEYLKRFSPRNKAVIIPDDGIFNVDIIDNWII